jgi:hypothetical protein
MAGVKRMNMRRWTRLINCLNIALLVLLLQGMTPPSAQAISPPPAPLAEPNAGWEEIGAASASGGGISDNESVSVYPSLAVAPDGTPYVAWEDWTSGDYEIYVRRWNGERWEEVGTGSASNGGISDNQGDSSGPSLAIGPDGRPYVAWCDTSGGKWAVYVRRWNGSTWEEVGTGSASEGGISGKTGYFMRVSLAMAADGTPYVAWEDPRSGNYEIYVRRWNGSVWEEVGTGSASGGGVSNNESYSRFPWLAIAPDGTAYIAWHDMRGGGLEIADIYVRRWNGSAWQEVGTGSASEGGISNTGSAYDPTLAVAPDGTPYVTWCDESSGGWQIYVRRWDGSAWQEVGVGSASGGGVSDNSGRSEAPVLSIAPDGTPYVAWEDYADGDYEIYVRRWNGESWEEVESGSASGGGISDNQKWSTSPCLMAAPDGTFYVAWDDPTDGDDEIYVRRWRSQSRSREITRVFLPVISEATAIP